MCLSIPAEVIKINGDTATVSVSGATYEAGIQLVPGLKPGDFILLHSGFAIQKIDPEEAKITMDILNQMKEQG